MRLESVPGVIAHPKSQKATPSAPRVRRQGRRGVAARRGAWLVAAKSRGKPEMKLYGAPKPAPNPRRVRMFLAEKGIDLAETPVDMMKREHKSTEYRKMNSLGQVPTLELD